MTTTATVKHQDRLLRFERDLAPQMPKGVAFYDYLPRIPTPCITRTWTTAEHETRIMECEPGMILCAGAAVGLDRHGRVQHVRDYHELQGFVGFVDKTVAHGRLLIRTRGQLQLLIPGGGKRVPGTPVFALNPDEFTLDATAGGHQIGGVVYWQPENNNLATIAFKSFDDSRPLDLNLSYVREAGAKSWSRP